jgi:hypothetical protein
MRSMMISLVVFACGHLAHAEGCVNAYGGQAFGTAGTIGFSPSGVDASIQAGITKWTSACNQTGTGFPGLAIGNGDLTITVVFLNEVQTDARYGCGQFDPVRSAMGILQGGTLTLWSSSVVLGDCEPLYGDVVAHEIGHILGLDESNCPGYIMSPNTGVPNSRNVQGEECSTADSRWHTPAETPPPPPGGPPGGGGPPSACDPGHGGCATGFPEPLIIDLNGDGIHTVAFESRPVSFDMDGNGSKDLTAWTDPLTEEGFLFFDTNRNGLIDGGQELFGDATILLDGSRATTGVQVLGLCDTGRYGGNGDGVISPLDLAYWLIRVWVDRNDDGIATRDETSSLLELGITEVSTQFRELTAAESYGMDAAGNFHKFQGSYTRRVMVGHRPSYVRRAMDDVFFRAVLH